jgi:hypothetical protein
MGIFCKRWYAIRHISMGRPYTKMIEDAFLPISNRTEEITADQALYTVEANRMN